MIEVYSNNVEVGDNSSVPLNNVFLVKGVTATKNGDTIQLNSCGVYVINVDGAVTIPSGTTATFQLEKNGVLQPQAITTVTGTTGNIIPFSFETIVQVPFNNTPCPCSAPTTIELISATAVTINHINMVITKIA